MLLLEIRMVDKRPQNIKVVLVDFSTNGGIEQFIKTLKERV